MYSNENIGFSACRCIERNRFGCVKSNNDAVGALPSNTHAIESNWFNFPLRWQQPKSRITAKNLASLHFHAATRAHTHTHMRVYSNDSSRFIPKIHLVSDICSIWNKTTHKTAGRQWQRQRQQRCFWYKPQNGRKKTNRICSRSRRHNLCFVLTAKWRNDKRVWCACIRNHSTYSRTVHLKLNGCVRPSKHISHVLFVRPLWPHRSQCV